MVHYAHLSNRGILMLKGKDALGFINKLITNNASVDNLVYTCMLNPKGRFLCDFFVLAKSQEELLIDIAKSFTKPFISKLRLYDIDEDIKIEKLDNLFCIASLSCISNDFLPDPRLASLGFRAYLNKDNLNNLSSLNNLSNDFNYHLHRLQYLVPDGDADLEPEKSIILEYNFEALNAISFSKGCYPGQELMARTKHRGQIRKSLALLKQKYTSVSPQMQLCSEITYNELQKNFDILKVSDSGLASSFNIADCGFTLLSHNQDLRLCLVRYAIC